MERLRKLEKFGTKVGMGLSDISILHLFQNGFHSDKNYFVRLTDSEVIIFRGQVKRPKRNKVTEKSLENLKDRTRSQEISPAVHRRIMKYINAWFMTIDFSKTNGFEDDFKIKKHLGILTLTLPARQMHSDKYLKRYALMLFIKDLKKQFPTLNYLWRAEAQANGNIHFHIIIDEFIDKTIIDKLWYRRMQLLGYIDAYKGKTGKDNPPMCNVESLRDKTSAGAYVAKYFSKKDDRRMIEGRVWGCCDKIKEMEIPEMNVNETELNELLKETENNFFDLYITSYCVILTGVATIDKLFQKALRNYKYYNTLILNAHKLYEHQYNAFEGQLLTDWEKDIIEEIGPIMASYLFENDMIGLQ